MADHNLSGLRIEKTTRVPRRPVQRRVVYLVAALAAVAVLGFLSWRGVFTGVPKVDTVTVVRIFPSQAFTVLNASGYVVPQRKAAVASKVTGRLVSLTVEEGSVVREGQIIARLESDDVVAARSQAAANLDVAGSNLDQAKAELNDAASAFERERNLLAKEFTTRASYDAAEARFKKARAAVAAAEATVGANRAALRAAEVAVEYTLIRVPFSAVVLTKNADVGDIITPLGAAANAKAAVVTIADLNSLQVEADVSESNLQKIRVGQPCEIELDGVPEVRFQGAIHMIVPTADRTKATVMVKVKFLTQDPRILPEMSAKVAFLSRSVEATEAKPRVAVNRKAVTTRKGVPVLFVVKGERVREVPVSLGEKLGDMVEVREGAQVGDKVVTDPPEGLKGGSRVRVQE